MGDQHGRVCWQWKCWFCGHWFALGKKHEHFQADRLDNGERRKVVYRAARTEVSERA